MKKLLLTILILCMFGINSFAEEVLTEFDDTNLVVLNEELRDLSRRVKTRENGDSHFRFTIIDPATIYTFDTQICITPALDKNITITNIEVTCDADPATEVTGDLKWADAFIGLANATVINDFDTAAGVRSDDYMTEGDVLSGKTIYIQFDAAPDSSLKQITFDITYE